MWSPNYVDMQGWSQAPNFGYVRTPSGSLPRANALEEAGEVVNAQRFLSTVLWPLLFQAFPNWCYGLQGTGDCVSWMVGHQSEISDAVRNAFNPRITELLRTATESIYAFGKCELFNSYSFHGDGMMGIDGTQAVEKFGRLLRKRYGDIDLSMYNGGIAEAWGERPRRSHGVPDELEPEAAKHKMLCHLEVTDCNTAAAFIEAGYSVGFCGNTSWGIRVDSKGFADDYRSGGHAMAMTGVLYLGKTPSHFWVANTGHGNHVEGNFSRRKTPVYYCACGSWVPVSIIKPVLLKGDCFVISPDGKWHVHTLPTACVNPDNLY